CVQYRERDFNFASRLLEEEGIYYFCTHSENGHEMLLVNTPLAHPFSHEQSTFHFDELHHAKRDELRICNCEESQELRSSKSTLWDHCFELPHKHLEVDKTILDSVEVGKVTHKLKTAENSALELYDFPGGYAQRFDGVAPGGGDRPADVQKIFSDNRRTVQIRMEQETVPGIVVQDAGNGRMFVSGDQFVLDRHYNGDGKYVLTQVEHIAQLEGDYRSGETTEFNYQNRFVCIPLALPFRPQRVSRRPVVEGTQTAVVVGPPG